MTTSPPSNSSWNFSLGGSSQKRALVMRKRATRPFSSLVVIVLASRKIKRVLFLPRRRPAPLPLALHRSLLLLRLLGVVFFLGVRTPTAAKGHQQYQQAKQAGDDQDAPVERDQIGFDER